MRSVALGGEFQWGGGETTGQGDIRLPVVSKGNSVQRSVVQMTDTKQEWRSLPPGRGFHLEYHVLQENTGLRWDWEVVSRSRPPHSDLSLKLPSLLRQ